MPTEISKEIYNDVRYTDIGDLPTGFGPYKDVDQIYARAFTVAELSLLYKGARSTSNGLDHIIRAVNMCISCDVNVLTDGDFEYIMAWLRLNSFPKGPCVVTWVCKKTNVVHKKGKKYYTEPDAKTLTRREMLLKDLEFEVCDKENVEIVHNAQMQINSFEDDDIIMRYPDLDFPRVSTLLELDDLVANNPELKYEAQIARWVKKGKTLKQKMEELSRAKDLNQYNRILECQKRYLHGIYETMDLRCRGCGNKVKNTSYPNHRTFFADNSDKDILDIQYSLLSSLGLQPDDNMPSKKFLYHNSCLAKDKQVEQERINLQNAVNRP